MNIGIAGGAPLSPATVGLRARTIAAPTYARELCQIGVVHLGPGAFHRAHQAVYFDDLLQNGELRWAICGVSLRSAALWNAIAKQGCLYTLAILDRKIRYRIIGSIQELLVAQKQLNTVFSRLASPKTRIVSLTITEKGYCLTPSGELNEQHADIVHDLQNPRRPRSAIGILVEALRLRHAANIAPFTALSCDNLANNGKRLERAVTQYTGLVNKELVPWIESEASFPCTVVDSITPATDDVLRGRVEEETGFMDAWPIKREAFSQWVVEDRFASGRPPLESVGVTMTNDVAPFEKAKLRLLNGAHSTIAYVGALCGYETVSQAVSDKVVLTHVEAMMREEIAPSMPGVSIDLDEYIGTVLQRFENPTIHHMLSQIAWDGSQKLPFRIIDSVRDNLVESRGIGRLCFTVAAWFHFVRRSARMEIEIVDPLATELLRIARSCIGTAQTDILLFGQLDSVFEPALYAEPRFRQQLLPSYELIEKHGIRAALLKCMLNP